MERINECSRCGALYREQPVRIWVCRQESETTTVRLMLCQECQTQLEAWLKEAKA